MRSGLGETEATHDGTVRLRPPAGLKARTRHGDIDLTAVARVLGKVAIPERAFMDGLRLEGALRAVLSGGLARPDRPAWLAVRPCPRLGYGNRRPSVRACRTRTRCALRRPGSERRADLRTPARATTRFGLVHSTVLGALRRQPRPAGPGAVRLGPGCSPCSRARTRRAGSVAQAGAPRARPANHRSA